MRLAGLAIRQQKYAPMEALTAVNIGIGFGLEGDSRGKSGKRQVTILSLQSWQQACSGDKRLNESLSWLARRANLLLDGYEFSEIDVGKIICIGEMFLQITREMDPCERMEEQQEGLFDALLPNWRGGVCCKVLHGGLVSLGDLVEIKEMGE